MTEAHVLDMAYNAMWMAVKLSAPILLTSLAVGLAVSLFQSVTQLQEVTLTFVPKVVAIALVLAFTGHWMLSSFVAYTQALFGQIPSLLG